MKTATALLNASTVTRKLQKLGFRHGGWIASSAVRGWGNHSEGFETEAEVNFVNGRIVQKWHYTQKRGHHQRGHYVEDKEYTGRVFVTYQQSTRISATYVKGKDEEQLAKMQTALEAEGFTVEFEPAGEGWAGSKARLIVTR